MKNILQLAMLTLVIQSTPAKPVGEFLIANRGGSLTFVDQSYESQSIHVSGDLHSTEVAEPMYVTPLGNSKGQRMVAFADRTLNTLSIINGNTRELLSQIEISEGAFHQFSHPLVGLCVAVATDIDKGMDLITLSDNGKHLTKRHFEIPDFLKTGKPHDVVMDRNYAYLTVKGVEVNGEVFDALLQVDRKSLALMNVRIFSEDIHLFSPVKAGYFAVVEQVTGDLHLLEKGTMKTLKTHHVAKGIHGISGSENGKFLFIADIDEKAGSPALYPLEVSKYAVKELGSIALNSPTAHNVAVDDRGETFSIVVTHSGGSSIANSLLEFSTQTKKLKLKRDLRTGINPFGLTFF